MKKKLPIGEVARRTGLSSSAIRFYESEGLLPRAEREGGRRIFDDTVLDQINFIELSKRAGFSLAEIGKLLADFSRTTPPGVRWRALAERKRADLDQRIAEAEAMKEALSAASECGCSSFRDCAEIVARISP